MESEILAAIIAGAVTTALFLINLWRRHKARRFERETQAQENLKHAIKEAVSERMAEYKEFEELKSRVSKLEVMFDEQTKANKRELDALNQAIKRELDDIKGMCIKLNDKFDQHLEFHNG